MRQDTHKPATIRRSGLDQCNLYTAARSWGFTLPHFRKNGSSSFAYSAHVAAPLTTGWTDYQARLDRVIDYIHDHINGSLDLNCLADVACLSPYHWHRIYHAMLGETVAASVRRIRLHGAAGELVRGDRPLRVIAAAYGFNSVQSFARAFRKSFGTSPGEYRRLGKEQKFQMTREEYSVHMYAVSIEEREPAQALTCRHRGSYMQIGKAFDHLSGWLATHNAIRPDMRLIAIYYDDPALVPEEQLRSCAGVLMTDAKAMESPFDVTAIRGGPYAILRHKGPYGELARAYQWLYGQWLPNSGREAGDAPVLEEYLNTPRDTAPPDLLTDICLPLR